MNAFPEDTNAPADPALLLDEICDPLQAMANLVHLLEDAAGDASIVRDYSRLLSAELDTITAAAHQTLRPGFYAPRAVSPQPHQ